MATLLAYLGPPEHKPVADTHWSSLNLTSSKFEEFMTRWGRFPADRRQVCTPPVGRVK